MTPLQNNSHIFISKVGQSKHSIYKYNSFIPLNKKSNFIPLIALDYKTLSSDTERIKKKQFDNYFILNEHITSKIMLPNIYYQGTVDTLPSARTNNYFDLQQPGITIVKSVYEKEYIYYALGKGTCILLNNDLSINKILYTTVIYKPAIELLYLNNGNINPKFIKLLITNNITPHIKNYLKKYIIPSANAANIDNIRVNNFNEIVSNRPIPKIKNFKEMKEIYAKEAIKRYFDYTESTS